MDFHGPDAEVKLAGDKLVAQPARSAIPRSRAVSGPVRRLDIRSIFASCIFVSPTKRRWCLKRRYSWYWYRDEKTLVDECFLQAGPKKVRVVPPKRSRKAEQAQPRG